MDVVVLAGGPRTPATVAAVGRPLWKLPISSTHTILDGWSNVLRDAIGKQHGFNWRRAVLLESADASGDDSEIHSGFEVQKEFRPHRGTAGVVADELRTWEDDGGLVLVIEASSSPAIRVGDLLARYRALVGNEPWGVLGESELGRYCGAFLCNRGVFGGVPSVGFFDLKEQLLPDLASRSATLEAVCVADRARSMRTREGWLSIVADWAAFRGEQEPLCQDELKRQQMSGHGCVVHPSAQAREAILVSSVLMEDVIVEPGAIVARSIVGPGVTVKAGSRVIDTIVGRTFVSSAGMDGSVLNFERCRRT